MASQFDAVRKLHALIRTKGESRELLSALVRGYCQLQLLTCEYQLDLHRVFQARALIYQSRIQAKYGKDADSQALEASAIALTHFFAPAQQRFSKWEKKYSGQKLSSFQTMAKAYAQYDVDALEPFLETEEKELASLLIFSTFYYSSIDNDALREKGLDAWHQNPLSFRIAENTLRCHVFEMIYDTANVRFDEFFQKLLPTYVDRLSDISETIRENATKMSTVTKRTKYGLSLFGQSFGFSVKKDDSFDHHSFSVDANKLLEQLKNESVTGKETGEPSLEAFSVLLRDQVFMSAYLYSHYRSSHNGNAKKYIEQMKPVLASHPLFFLFDQYPVIKRGEYDLRKNNQNYKSQVCAIKYPINRVSMASYRSYPFSITEKGIGNYCAPWVTAGCFVCPDNIRDQYHFITICQRRYESKDKAIRPFITFLREWNPRSPLLTEYWLMYSNKEITEQDTDKIKQNFGNFPNVQNGLKSFYQRTAQWEKANNLLKAKVHREWKYDDVQQLAWDYLYDHNPAEAVKLYEEYLTKPDAEKGLRDSLTNGHIAEILLGDRSQKVKMLAAARKGSRSWAAHPMVIYGQCLKRSGNFDQCYKVMMDMIRNYPEDSYIYRWPLCYEFGLKDEKEARDEILLSDEEFKKEYKRKKTRPDKPSRNEKVMVCYCTDSPYPKEYSPEPLLHSYLVSGNSIFGMLAFFDAVDKKDPTQIKRMIAFNNLQWDYMIKDKIFMYRPVDKDEAIVFEKFNNYSLLAAAMGRLYRTGECRGELTQETIDRLLARTHTTPCYYSQTASYLYFFGRFFAANGQKEKAREYYKKSLLAVSCDDQSCNGIRCYALKELAKDGFTRKDYEKLMQEEDLVIPSGYSIGGTIERLLLNTVEDGFSYHSTKRLAEIKPASTPEEPGYSDYGKLQSDFLPGCWKLKKAFYKNHVYDRSETFVYWRIFIQNRFKFDNEYLQFYEESVSNKQREDKTFEITLGKSMPVKMLMGLYEGIWSSF